MSNAATAQAKRTLTDLRGSLTAAAMEHSSGVTVPQQAPIPGHLRREFRDYAFVEWLLWGLKCTIAVNVVFAVVLVVANYKAARKDGLLAKAPASLRTLADEYYRVDGIRFDQVATTIVTVLPLLHHVDDGGAAFLPLLQGVVAPEVYREAENGIRQALPEIRKNMAVQNLNITSISDYDTDPKTRRVSCFVRGYFTVILAQPGQQAGVSILPYRAEVLLEQNTVGNLNPLPFTLIRRTEKMGEKALEWDRARKAAKGGPS